MGIMSAPAKIMVLAAAVLSADVVLSGRHGQTARPAECVTIETPARLETGESFATPVGRGLEFRLTPDAGGTWWISVGPDGTRDDYLWVVSPPLQTAPHLAIGKAYNLTAAQSARLSPRRLRFVTSAEEYRQALDLVNRVQGDSTARITAAEVEHQAKGSLELWITDFKVSEGADALAWITVRVRACHAREE